MSNDKDSVKPSDVKVPEKPSEAKPTEEKSKGPVERVLDQLVDPFDWIAAFLGGAVGATVTTASHGLDLGHSIPSGALGGVALKKTIFASFSRFPLRKMASRLNALLATKSHPGAKALIFELQQTQSKWEAKIIRNEEFRKKLADISNRDDVLTIASFTEFKDDDD
jgi:hypothetical protein